MDLLPTIAALCGGTLPENRKIDGRDVSALLRGGTLNGAEEHPFFYYQRQKLEAIRVGRYKLHVPHYYDIVETGEQRKIELSLFDLEADIGETTNIADKHPDVVNKLLALCEQARRDLGDHDIGGAGVRPPGTLK